LKKIEYISHKYIDFDKWDTCVSNSINGLIYGYSFYLNALCNEDWDAIIVGDYDAIFPLPFKKKYGLFYLYQPYFCQQLGIMSKLPINQILVKNCIKKIPFKFFKVNIQLNYANKVFFRKKYKIQERTNYILKLSPTYDEIFANFSKDAKKNLNKIKPTQYTVSNFVDEEAIISLFFETYSQFYGKQLHHKKYILNLLKKGIAFQKGFARTIIDASTKEIWCMGYFFKSHNRIYYIIAAPTSLGKKNNASHILINEIIKEFAGQNIYLDFEGSDLPNVAQFYKKFSPEKEIYYQLSGNVLLRLMDY